MKKIRKSQITLYSCLGFIIGVAIASFLELPELLFSSTSVFVILMIIFSKRRSRVRLVGWCLLFMILGMIRYQISIPQINQGQIAFYNNQNRLKFSEQKPSTFQGIISDEPDSRNDQIKYQVSAEKIKQADSWRRVSGQVLVSAGLFPQYQYGDFLEISCSLVEPAPIEDFAYDKYLAKSEIYSLCYRPTIKLMGSGKGNFFKSIIFKIKDKVVQTVGQILPEPQSSFLGGLLWGAKKGMPAEILENFSRTGVTHIIAVSGYNITIIAVMLSNLFIGFGLSRKKAFWLIVFGIIFFVMITGSPASIVRAGIMGIVALIATAIGRATKMHHTLVIVCLLMLLSNPKVLIWDAGFQLSFLATIGLIYFVPIMEKYTNWLPKIFSIRESLTTTLSAIVLTTPLILFQFGRFSFLAPLANLLILPIIPVNMGLGFLAVIFGLIWIPLGKVFAWISWLTLTYVLKLTELLAKVSWASLELPNLHWLLLVVGYLFIGYLIIKSQRRTV